MLYITVIDNCPDSLLPCCASALLSLLHLTALVAPSRGKTRTRDWHHVILIASFPGFPLVPIPTRFSGSERNTWERGYDSEMSWFRYWNFITIMLKTILSLSPTQRLDIPARGLAAGLALEQARPIETVSYGLVPRLASSQAFRPECKRKAWVRNYAETLTN